MAAMNADEHKLKVKDFLPTEAFSAAETGFAETGRDGAYEAALRDLAAALGSEHVITDPVALRAAEAGTFLAPRRIPAIIRPGSRSEVQESLRILNGHKVPVYPISSGKNWGYGSRVPSAD